MSAGRIHKASVSLGVVAAVLAAALPARAEWEGVRGLEPIMPRWTHAQRQDEIREMALRGLNPSERVRRLEQMEQHRTEQIEQARERVRTQQGTETRRQDERGPTMGENPVQDARDHVRQSQAALRNNDHEGAAEHLRQAETIIRRIDDGGNRHVRRFLDDLERDMAETRERLRAGADDAARRLDRIEERIRTMTPQERTPEQRQ